MRNYFLLAVTVLTLSYSAQAAVDTELLGLIPSGAKTITSVDIERARASDFGQYLLGRINSEDRSLQELAQQTGFDPRRDLQSFVFANTGPVSKTTRQFVILARGNFDPARIGAAAKAKGAVLQNYQGVDVFLCAPHDKQTALAFPDTGLAVFGDLETVHQVISNRSNPTTLDSALLQLISKIGMDNDAWFASVAPGTSLIAPLSRAEGAGQVPAQAFRSITGSSGGIRLGSDVQISFDAITRSPKDATSLADVVRFLSGMAQMQMQKEPTMPQADLVSAALNNLNLKTDGDDVYVSVSLPEKSLEQLAGSGAGMNTRRSRPTSR